MGVEKKKKKKKKKCGHSAFGLRAPLPTSSPNAPHIVVDDSSMIRLFPDIPCPS
jgi:hypothetical protein